MIGYGLDRGGLKDSENAPNSFLTKINEKGFWRFAVDMLLQPFTQVIIIHINVHLEAT